jgi:hypothetical protein
MLEGVSQAARKRRGGAIEPALYPACCVAATGQQGLRDRVNAGFDIAGRED